MCAVVAALATTLAMAGTADAVSLHAYKVKVRGGTLEKLASAGFDVTEGRRGTTITVVGTRAQAQRLAGKGVQARDTGARVIDDYGPGEGYRIYRPYDRPAYNNLGNNAPNLVEQMQTLAADHPGIVKLERIGTTNGGPEDPDHPDPDGDLYTDPKPIYAVKVSRDARSEPDGSKPAVLYSSTQHAREWLSTETNRRTMRLFIDNYGGTGTAVGVNGDPVTGVTAEEITQLVNTRELWFILVANPDGYDYTFQDEETRLWRKNLRDNNGDEQLTVGDGVDPNRNFPTHWGYDNEGSSEITASETYRGSGPASEPETKALDGLSRRVNFEFNNNFHTCGPLLLYPLGWQVDTFTADDPLFRAIAGSDENPAVESYNPDVGGNYNPGVGAELYTTNGDTNDHLYSDYGTLSFTPELDPGDPDVDPDTDGCFIFQDDADDVESVFQSQIQFSLDMARSAEDPADVQSHLGNKAPNFEADSFDVSYGDPQTAQVSAKRKLGAITLHWQVDGGDEQTAPTAEWKGGERYGDEGDVYYRRMRGDVTGTSPGDHVKVWFTAAGGETSKAFTYRVASDTGNPVLVIAQENYSGNAPVYPDTTQPAYLGTHGAVLDALGVKYDVWDVDAHGMQAPDPLGVLSHYKGVVWYTGDDSVTRLPGQPGGSGAARVANDVVVNVRDYLNEGGKLLLDGNMAGSQFFVPFVNSQFGEPVPGSESGYCPGNVLDADTDAAGCIPLSNDFFQYWLGGYTLVDGAGFPLDGDKPFDVSGVGDLSGFKAGLNAADRSAPGTTLVTSSILPADRFPQFRSESLLEYDRPGASPYDPFTGDWYLFSSAVDNQYHRITKTVDLTGKTGGKLDFQVSLDTEPGYDWAFVEAHTPGEDDWTTLALTNDAGDVVTSQGPPYSCGGDGYTWLDDHPFLLHYMTPGATTNDPCTSTGTSGEFNGLTSGQPEDVVTSGWRHLNADLSAYDGQPVELSITYVQDPAVSGLGVFVDDLRTSADDGELSLTSFESDLGGWEVAPPPEGSPLPVSDWTRKQSAFDETPATATEDTVWLTFGLETVDTDENRVALTRAAFEHLGLLTPPEPSPEPTAEPTAEPTTEPTAEPTGSPTATPTPAPARKGRVAIGRRTVRAVGRKLSLRVKCINTGGKRCRVGAAVGKRKRVYAAGAFRIPVDAWSTIKLRLKRSAYRKLKHRGKLRVVYAVTARANGRTYKKAVRITLLAPK